MLTSGSEEKSRLEGKAKLRRSQNEELTPARLEQDELIAERQGLEGRHVPGPLDTHEEEAGGYLTHDLGACHVRYRRVAGILHIDVTNVKQYMASNVNGSQKRGLSVLALP